MAAGQNWHQPIDQTPGGAGSWGGGAFAIMYRSPLDAARAARNPRIPAAEYPDGYLGNVRSRREDRLLNALRGRINERGYARGVHKGEQLDTGDYFWPVGGPVDPEAGLRAEARGQRWTARGGTPVEQFVAGGANARSVGLGMLGLVDQAQPIDPAYGEGLRTLLPAWR